MKGEAFIIYRPYDRSASMGKNKFIISKKKCFFFVGKYGSWTVMHRILIRPGKHGNVVTEYQLENVKCKNENSLVTCTWARDLETPLKNDHDFKTSQEYLERQTALVW